MANVIATYLSAGAPAPSAPGAGMLVMSLADVQNETVETSGSSEKGNLTSTQPRNRGLLDLLAEGGDVWVTIGVNPTAVAGEGYLLRDGERAPFAIQPGETFAAIDRPAS